MLENSNVCFICICRERLLHLIQEEIGEGDPQTLGLYYTVPEGLTVDCPLTGLGSSSRSMASGAFWSITQQHPRITW